MLRIFRKNQPLIQNHNGWRIRQNPQHSRKKGNGCARIIYQKWWCRHAVGKRVLESVMEKASKTTPLTQSKTLNPNTSKKLLPSQWENHWIITGYKKILLLRISTNTQLQKQWKMEPIYLQRSSPSISQIPQKPIVSPFFPHNLSIPAPKTPHSSLQHRKKHKRAYNDISATKK